MTWQPIETAPKDGTVIAARWIRKARGWLLAREGKIRWRDNEWRTYRGGWVIKPTVWFPNDRNGGK